MSTHHEVAHGEIRTSRSRWSTPPAATFAVAGTVALWASAFVAIRFAVASVSPVSVAVVRFVVASSVLALVTTLVREPPAARRAWPRLALVGLAGVTVYNLALNYGLVHVQAGATSFLINTTPMFTALFAVLLLGESPRRGVYVGLLVGFAGAALIMLGQGEGVRPGWSAAVILLAAVAHSLYFVLQKPVLADHSPLQVVSAAVWTGTLLLLPFAGRAFADVLAAPAAAQLAVLYLGIFPAALAFVLWSYALARMPASTAATYLYAVPPTTVLLGALFLGELPTLLTLFGGAVALTGVWITNRSRTHPWRALEARGP